MSRVPPNHTPLDLYRLRQRLDTPQVPITNPSTFARDFSWIGICRNSSLAPVASKSKGSQLRASFPYLSHTDFPFATQFLRPLPFLPLPDRLSSRPSSPVAHHEDTVSNNIRGVKSSPNLLLMPTRWKDIPTIPNHQQMTDIVLSSTQRKLPTQIRAGFKISRIRVCSNPCEMGKEYRRGTCKDYWASLPSLP